MKNMAESSIAVHGGELIPADVGGCHVPGVWRIVRRMVTGRFAEGDLLHYKRSPFTMSTVTFHGVKGHGSTGCC